MINHTTDRIKYHWLHKVYIACIETFWILVQMKVRETKYHNLNHIRNIFQIQIYV